MSDDEEYTDRRLSKRQRLIHMIAIAKCPNKQLQGFVDQSKDKADALFAIPPCDIKEADFFLRFGLVLACEDMPSYDRFRKIEMRDETLRHVNHLIARDLAYSSTFQGGDGLDIQFAPLLDRLTRNIGRFTRPRDQGTDDKKRDLSVVYVDELENKPPGDYESCSSEDEAGRPQGASLASPNQHLNMLLYVYRRRHSMHGRQLKVVKNMKTTAAVRRLFQPAMYVIDELRETVTLSKEYRRPVYVVAEDRNRWCYGILEIYGYAHVKDQKLVGDCLPDEDEQGSVNGNKVTPSFTKEEVVKAFGEWKKKMSVNDMRIPDGLHPVGRFFYSSQQYHDMPSVCGTRPLGTGAMRYLDGMLKVLVGR